VAGFIRRFGFFPGVETITLIEGVVIVDTPPPGNVSGVSTGTVALVGEFPDMTFACAVDSAGAVTTRCVPVEIFSGQDLLDKVGGWDATLGNFGVNRGNGFAAIRNKKFSRLVLAPVNLACSAAGRAWRDLPTNLSATQAVPTVPLQGGRVDAGREFRSGVNRVRLASKAVFTALGHFKNGIDGAVTSAGAAATQTFNSATGGFLTAQNGGPVKKGAILVVGTIGGAGALGGNAFTLRVTADAVSATALVVQRLDGASFDWTTGTALPYRVHYQTDADTGGTGGINTALADTAGYTLPARTLDATIAAATTCAPTVVPAAATATSWDSLSGLALRSHVSSGFVYVATTQAPNAVNDAAIDALYVTAIDALAQDVAPSRDVNIIYHARTSQAIRSKLRSHVLDVSGVGLGRIAVLSPGFGVTTSTAATADADPGVGATRNERVIYAWPGARTYIPEAVGTAVGTADGLTTTDGILDTAGNGWMAAVLSNLPPERNPGQAGEPVATLLSPILGLQRGLGNLVVGDYVNLRANGVAALRIDRQAGPIFQSGVTTSLTSGQKNIARRRMADFIQDSVSNRLVQFTKQPLTQSLKDSITGEVDAFLNQLKSPSNPPAQRIVDYEVDDVSGNTPALESQGIFVLIGRARTLASADFIVFQTEIGEGVVITSAN
jgi:hypothetical protein